MSLYPSPIALHVLICSNYLYNRYVHFIGFTGGDLHVLTPDGLSYTFNGFGEFWLVMTDQCLEIQVRFGPNRGDGETDITNTTHTYIFIVL